MVCIWKDVLCFAFVIFSVCECVFYEVWTWNQFCNSEQGNYDLSMKVIHLVWKEHTHLRGTWYGLSLFVRIKLLWGMLCWTFFHNFCLQCLFVWFYIYFYFIIHCVSGFVSFGGKACYVVASDQPKYHRCIFAILICIKMWFEICLQNKIHCKKK